MINYKNKIKNTIFTIKKTLKLVFVASPRWLIITIILNAISGLLVALNLFIWKYFIDSATATLKDNSAYKIMLLFLILHFTIALIMGVLEQISIYTQTIYGELLDKEITRNTIEKLEQLDLIDYELDDTYNIIQRATQQSFQRSISILTALIQIIKGISSLIGTFVFLLKFNSIIIILCIASIIPMFYINNKILEKWYDVFNKRYEQVRFVNYLKSLYIQYENIKEFKIFNVGKYINKTILSIYDCHINQDKSIRKKFLSQTSKMKIIDYFTIYFIKGIIIFNCIRKKLTIGSLITYMQSVDILKSSMNNIMGMFSQAYEDSLYMDNLLKLLNMKSKKTECKYEFNTNFKRIDFDNVSFKYEKKEQYVIKNFSFTFYSGHTYALVGLNGSGKTTLIKLLLGLYDVKEGNILIDGINLKDIDKDSYYLAVSAIFQDFIKYPFDVKTNITIADSRKKFTEAEIHNAAGFSGANEFISDLPNKYNTKLMKEWSDGVELSLGQWQKIAVSRAAIKDSTILILDEPTASIDVVTEFKLFSNFKDLKKNKLCLLVTHRFSNIRFVDYILVLENGVLKENGNHNNLMKKNGIYKELYEIQAEAFNEN